MAAQVCTKDIVCDKVSIEKLRAFGAGRTHSRVGITRSQNGRQSKDWFWIIDQTSTVERYIQSCNIEPSDDVRVSFFI